MQATSEILAKVIVNNRSVMEKITYTYAAVISAIALPALLIFYAAPRLSIEGKAPRLFRWRRRAVTSVLLLIGLAVGFSQALPAHAAPLSAEEQPLQISVDLDHKVTNTGDRINFNTTVVNKGAQASPKFFVSMNIVKLGSGDPVDPEDWSPERSQAVASLGPGQSATQSWTVDTILMGNYMVYMTVIPMPDGPEATAQTTSGMGIHVTVNDVIRTNPAGVLPVAIGTPLILAAGTLLLRRSRRRPSPPEPVPAVA